jgi:hypothetical protein
MRTFILVGLLAAGSVHGHSSAVIPSNARIYIDADGEFNIFLTAALEKKHVPLIVTTDKSKADFALQGYSERGARSDDEASVRLVDLKRADVVFAWSIDKGQAVHGLQTAANACAKHLRGAVGKVPSPSPAVPKANSSGQDNALKTTAKKLQLWPSKDPALDF